MNKVFWAASVVVLVGLGFSGSLRAESLVICADGSVAYGGISKCKDRAQIPNVSSPGISAVRNARAEQKAVVDPCEVRPGTGSGPVVQEISSPIRMRVYQRKGGFGKVPVIAKLVSSADCVQARILADDGTTEVVGWTPVASGIVSAQTNVYQELTVPNGGWYFTQVRAIKGGAVGPVAAVDFIGVGEVFVTAGQSNSTFFGEAPQKTETGKVSYFDGAEWKICADALERVDPQSKGGAPWCLLGDMIVRGWGVPVAFAPSGWGGSSLNQWQKNATSSPGGQGVLYDRMKDMLRYFGAGGVRSVLWHQGESDFGTTSQDYSRKLKNVIEGSREGAGFDVPWLIAEVSYVGELDTAFIKAHCAPQSIDCNQYIHDQRLKLLNGQRALVDNKTIFKGAETDVLTGKTYRWDGIHMTVLGLQVSASSWADHTNAAFKDK